jgi:lipid A 3-O-deacylase PagL
MTPRTFAFTICLAIASTIAYAADFTPRECNVYLSAGRSPLNWHGHSLFRSVHLELAGESRWVKRWIPRANVGAAITYSDIRQARSWFGYRYGDPDDWVRAVSSLFFLRRGWRQPAAMQPYVELGSGPMWSNRRVPAATSRLNFHSQFGFGATLFAHSRSPLRIGYRFSHISNGEFARRNPGLNVHTVLVGARLFGARALQRSSAQGGD